MIIKFFAVALFVGASTQGSEPIEKEVVQAEPISQTRPIQAIKTSDAEKIVCTYEMVAGSKIPTKLCMTKFQREQLDRDIKEEHGRRASASECNDRNFC